MTTTLHEDLCAFMTTDPPVLKMKTASDESCRETHKHKIYVQQLVSENRVVYEIM
jgi:hypothetical protein